MKGIFVKILISACLSASVSKHIAASDVSVTYDVDLLKNTQGGLSTDFEYIDLFTVSASDQLAVSSQVSLDYYVSGIYSNGHTFSESVVGDEHIISNLEGGARFAKLAEAWVDISYHNFSVLFGLYDINGEFDVLESATLFLNSGHGIGNDIGLTGSNGPSIYPFYGLSARIAWKIMSNDSLMIAFIDGSPGNPQKPSNIAVDLDSDDGIFSIAEWQNQREDHRWLLGAWQYSKSESITLSESINKTSGNWGIYVRHERNIVDDRILGFFRAGVSDDNFNKYDGFLGIGLVINRLFILRPDDTFGIAMAYNKLGDKFTDVNSLPFNNLHNDDHPQFANGELNVELTYQAKLNNYLSLQPNLQFIKHPAALGQDSALAIGLRISLSFE